MTRRILCPHFVQQDGGICSIWSAPRGRVRDVLLQVRPRRRGCGFLERAPATSGSDRAGARVAVRGDARRRRRRRLAASGRRPAMRATTPWRYVRTERTRPADLRAIWGRWAGRERAFYEAAAERRREPVVAGDHRAGGAPGSSARHPRARSPRALAARRRFPGDRFAAAHSSPPRSTPDHRAPHDLQRHGSDHHSAGAPRRAPRLRRARRCARDRSDRG